MVCLFVKKGLIQESHRSFKYLTSLHFIKMKYKIAAMSSVLQIIHSLNLEIFVLSVTHLRLMNELARGTFFKKQSSDTATFEVAGMKTSTSLQNVSICMFD